MMCYKQKPTLTEEEAAPLSQRIRILDLSDYAVVQFKQRGACSSWQLSPVNIALEGPTTFENAA
jgi:hypothetical protein